MMEVKVDAKSVDAKPAAATLATSFLEIAEKSNTFLARASRVQLSSAKRHDSAVELLRHEGTRLNSIVLSSLATQIQANPFARVKKMIEGLIDTLLTEANEDATKKSFCDK